MRTSDLESSSDTEHLLGNSCFIPLHVSLQSKLCFVGLFIWLPLGLDLGRMKEFSPEDPKGPQARRKTAWSTEWRELDAFGWEENPNKGKARRTL